VNNRIGEVMAYIGIKNENNSLGEGKFFILEKVLGDLLFWFIFCLLIFFILEIFKYNISKYTKIFKVIQRQYRLFRFYGQ